MVKKRQKLVNVVCERFKSLEIETGLVAMPHHRGRCGGAAVVFSIFYTLLKLLLDTKMESSAVWQCYYSKKGGSFFTSAAALM